MVSTIRDSTLQKKIGYYEIVGRDKTSTSEKPKIYKMKIFANNKVMAISRFWHHMRVIVKTKRSNGEIIRCAMINEKEPNKVKNYGVYVAYKSATGKHDMYKEYRDVSINGAVSQLYSEVAGRHRALPSAVSIYKIEEIANSEVKRPKVKQMLSKKLKWPMIRKIPKTNKKYSPYAHKRPSTFFK